MSYASWRIGFQSDAQAAHSAYMQVCDLYLEKTEQAERIKQLEEEAKEEDSLRTKMATLLSETAVALKGEEAELQRHSWHDLPAVALEKMKRIAQLEAENEALLDSQIDKIIALSDDQVSAMCRIEGSNPDDSATIAKQTMQLAFSNVRIAQLEDALREARGELTMQSMDVILKINEVLGGE